jgi:hypothetical protein
MTVYNHPIYRDLIHNEDATNQNKKTYIQEEMKVRVQCARHEGIWESGGTVLLVLNFGTTWGE